MTWHEMVLHPNPWLLEIADFEVWFHDLEPSSMAVGFRALGFLKLGSMA